MRRLLAVLILASVASATTYVITPTGSDANTGLPGHPWLTFAHACSVISSGDTIQLGQGTNGENYYLPTIVGGPIDLSTCPASFTITTTGGTPVITDLLQLTSNCGALTLGCKTVTWSTSTDYPCLGTCQLYKSSAISSASFNDTESFFYVQSQSGNNPLIAQRRYPPRSFYPNAMPQNCDSTLCPQTGGTQANADTACGCPGGVNGLHCAIQNYLPAFGAGKWYCGLIAFEYLNGGGSFSVNTHGMNVGDIEVWNNESWTQGTSRLSSVTNGSGANGKAQMSGALPYGTNYSWGFYPRDTITKVNEPHDLAAGEIYMERCPTGCPGNVPEATWYIYFAADTSRSEFPLTGTLFAAQMPNQCPDPQSLVGTGLLLEGTGVGPTINGTIEVLGGNWCPSIYGNSDFESQTNVPATVSFTNGVNGTIEGGFTIAHTAGWMLELEGSAHGWTIGDALVGDMAWYDSSSGGIRLGVHGNYTDMSTAVVYGNTIQNLALYHGGKKNPSGEPVGIWIGNGHDNLITHVDCAYWYTGCYSIGKLLGRDTSSGLGGQIYNNWVTYSTCSGVTLQGQTVGILDDFGCVHMASSLAANCPMTAGDPGTTIANFCNGAQYVFWHDTASNFQQSQLHGGSGFYPDQGTSYALCYACIIVRTGDDIAFMSSPDHINNFPNNDYDFQYNTILNSIIAFAGECEYNLNYVVGCAGSTGILDTHSRLINNLGTAVNQYRYRVLNSILLYDSAINQKTMTYGIGAPANWTAFQYGTFAGGPITPVAVDPVTVFKYANNLIWDYRGSFPQFYQCTTSNANQCQGGTSNINVYNQVPWGFDTGNHPTEDVGSLVCDPGLVAPVFGTDDWHPTNRTCLDKISWQTFDPTVIGRVNPTVTVPAQGNPYYNQLTINPAYDYCPNCVFTPVSSMNPDGGSGTTTWR